METETLGFSLVVEAQRLDAVLVCKQVVLGSIPVTNQTFKLCIIFIKKIPVKERECILVILIVYLIIN